MLQIIGTKKLTVTEISTTAVMAKKVTNINVNNDDSRDRGSNSIKNINNNNKNDKSNNGNDNSNQSNKQK